VRDRVALTRGPAPGGALLASLGRVDRGPLLAVGAAVALYTWLSVLEPDALSYNGLTLTLASTMPLMFVALSQMILISLGDLDLGNGYSVGLANVVSAIIMPQHPWLGGAALAAIVAAYAGMGALVQWRALPAIIVTLGASFVWLGLSLIVAPSPGGSSPAWLSDAANWNPPGIPLPLLVALVVAIAGSLVVVRTRAGVMLRATGSNPSAARAYGVSVPLVRVLGYTAAGVSIVIGGLLLTGLTQSGDANASGDFNLLSIAAVILGGAEFRGGRTPVIGAVCGALALTLVSPVLSALNVPSNYQTGAVGVVLVLVIAGRRLLQR
jgi:ribose transport system permease protein